MAKKFFPKAETNIHPLDPSFKIQLFSKFEKRHGTLLENFYGSNFWNIVIS
jgi:hypothetical protein